MCRGGRLASVVLATAVACAPTDSRGEDSSSEDAARISGQVLTALGAGTLSAVVTPVLVNALGRLGDEDYRSPLKHHYDPTATAVSVVSASLTLGVGIVLWRYGTWREREAIEKSLAAGRVERRSQGMYVAGIVLTSLGGAAALVTVGLAYTSSCDDSNPPQCTNPARPVAVGTAIGAGTMMAVGVPLWIVGGDRIPVTREPPAMVRLAPTGATLRMSF